MEGAWKDRGITFGRKRRRACGCGEPRAMVARQEAMNSVGEQEWNDRQIHFDPCGR